MVRQFFKSFFQEIERWKGENTGELVNLKEVNRAIRAMRASDAYKKVKMQGLEMTATAASIMFSKGNMLPASSSTLNVGSLRSVQPEEFCLVTRQSLVDACPMMQDEQAIDLIASAVYDYHKNNKGESNSEEMARSIRRVNHHTKRLKMSLKRSLHERQALHKNSALTESGSFSEGIGTTMVKLDLTDSPWKAPGEKSVRLDVQSVEDVKFKTFADQIGACHRELRAAMDWIGDDELREVDQTKLRRKPMASLEWHTVDSVDDAEAFSIKRIKEDIDEVLDACRDSEIDETEDKLRKQATGKICRVIMSDPTHPSLRCRIPGLGDLWFGCAALEHLRSPQKDVMSMRQARAASADRQVSSHDSIEDGEGRDLELLRIVNDLETEKRFGEQTVTEAINAVSELKWQQVKEKTDRSKLHQKIQGLKKKVISRHRLHRSLAQETARQEERLEIVTKSRDEYRDLLQNLIAERERLERRLGSLTLHDAEAHLALEDHEIPRDNGDRRGNGYGHNGNSRRRKNGHGNGSSDDDSFEQHARNLKLRDDTWRNRNHVDVDRYSDDLPYREERHHAREGRHRELRRPQR